MDSMVSNFRISNLLGYLCLVVLFGCSTTNQTFVMPVPVTYPEKRNVLTGYPVIPVEQIDIE